MNERYTETKCPVCGKIFYPECFSAWGWKSADNESVCSYSCQRKSENNPKEKPNPQRKRVPVRVVETGEIFRSISDCAAALGTPNINISKCIYGSKTHRGLHIERVV